MLVQSPLGYTDKSYLTSWFSVFAEKGADPLSLYYMWPNPLLKPLTYKQTHTVLLLLQIGSSGLSLIDPLVTTVFILP